MGEGPRVYDVRIRAIVTKKYEVIANDPDSADLKANEMFTANYDGVGIQEQYEQETIKVEVLR